MRSRFRMGAIGIGDRCTHSHSHKRAHTYTNTHTLRAVSHQQQQSNSMLLLDGVDAAITNGCAFNSICSPFSSCEPHKKKKCAKKENTAYHMKTDSNHLERICQHSFPLEFATLATYFWCCKRKPTKNEIIRMHSHITFVCKKGQK